MNRLSLGIKRGRLSEGVLLAVVTGKLDSWHTSREQGHWQGPLCAPRMAQFRAMKTSVCGVNIRDEGAQQPKPGKQAAMVQVRICDLVA